MLIERNSGEIVIKIPDGILGKNELENLLDFIRYKELTKKSKAKAKDLRSLLFAVKKTRKL